MKIKISIVCLLLFIASPILVIAQMTYVPDDNFEKALIDLGLDTPPLNDSIPTKNIDTETSLDVSDKNISNLTGIENFISLEVLFCNNNHLTSLDVINNLILIELDCSKNNLTSLDVSKNNALIVMYCSYNKLSSLDISSCSSLIFFQCQSNPDLTCIQVDDSSFAANNKDWKKDSTAHYSTDCGYTGVEDFKFENNSVSITPNPAMVFIEIELGNNHTLKGVVENVKIYNFLGEIIPGDSYTPPDPIFLEGGKYRIDISGLPPGVYFIRVGDSFQRFVKY